MTIRILRIVARMNVGGPAVEISTLMRGLPTESFEQLLLTGACAPDEADFLSTQPIDFPYRRVPGLGRAVRPWDDLKALVTVMRTIRQFQPDIIHTHTAKAGAIGRLAATLALNRTRCIHTYHGHVLQGYFRTRQIWVITQLERWFARRTFALITVGRQVRDDLLRAQIGTADQYVVIPPGVPVPSCPPRATARAQLDVPTEIPVVAYVGRITGIKRPDRLLEVAAYVSQNIQNCIFIVVGGGDLEKETRRTAAALDLPIRFLGWRTDVPAILAASDVMVLTSDNEGTPISLIEAGMCGVPVVATDVGAVKEVVVDGATGILTAPAAAPVAAAVVRVLHDPDLASRLGAQSMDYCQTEFSTDTFLLRHSMLYHDSMADSKNDSAR